MAITNTDLILVQRGSVPHKAEASVLSDYIKGDIEPTDLPIASASQLGVIKVGSNLTIESDGTLNADLPAGIQYQGFWTNASAAPTDLQNGYFWIWDGGDATLNNVSWGAVNGATVTDADRLYYNGTQFEILVTGSGDGGGTLVEVTGTAPISVSTADAARPDISISPATDSAAGSMSAADKLKLNGITSGAEPNVAHDLSWASTATQGTVGITNGNDATIPSATGSLAGFMSAADKASFDSLVATGGLTAVVAGNGISVDASNAAQPEVSVAFGAVASGTPVTVMPYDISMLAELT